eukprot:CAMPEP_0195516232 /NCGR_PEP_ID=MMETSP0794_2-20130614/7019_1 /TAXON_ID=515487 /ORGANISM="Stephanopyxis turris, Strain CCMP 815" /LENGTH=193 /DNA_ID=CAMNT_0040644779 /DNA_START=78 /DNA_END=659 /DNA_ORIENTATION=-
MTAKVGTLRVITPILLLVITQILSCSSFTLTMMGARRGKGNLKRNLESSSSPRSQKDVKSLNKGKGQEITGVTLPQEGKIKGWEFGNVQMATTQIDGRYYALQGTCPRCGFDLFKGKLVNEEAFGNEPVVACPTCSTTFSFKTGKPGPPYRTTGLAGFVSGLAKTATIKDASKSAVAYVITRELDGKVYCRER